MNCAACATGCSATASAALGAVATAATADGLGDEARAADRFDCAGDAFGLDALRLAEALGFAVSLAFRIAVPVDWTSPGIVGAGDGLEGFDELGG